MPDTCARDIEAKLASKYLTEQAGWAFLREVTIQDAEVQAARRGWDWRNPPGSDDPYWRPMGRRIDVLLMRTSAPPRTSTPSHESGARQGVARRSLGPRTDTEGGEPWLTRARWRN